MTEHAAEVAAELERSRVLGTTPPTHEDILDALAETTDEEYESCFCCNAMMNVTGELAAVASKEDLLDVIARILEEAGHFKPDQRAMLRTCATAMGMP